MQLNGHSAQQQQQQQQQQEDPAQSQLQFPSLKSLGGGGSSAELNPISSIASPFGWGDTSDEPAFVSPPGTELCTHNSLSR